jgi:hypothetical protein
VVDDEAGVVTEAFGSEPVTVAIAGHDEQVRAVGGGDDFAFDAADSLYLSARPIEPCGRGGQQVGGGLGGQFLEADAGIVFGRPRPSSPA